MSGESGPKTVSKGTMTEISMIQKERRPATLKPSGPPRRRSSFADQDKWRQSDLTDQEVKQARRIWAEYVEPIKEEFLAIVFKEFFAKNPELVDLFARLDQVGLPRLSLVEVPVFKNYHLGRIMLRLRQMMDDVDKPERLTRLMTKMGVLYAKLNLDGMHLEDFQNKLLLTIKLAMNSQMHPTEMIALKKCFDLAFSIMEEASFTYYDLFVAATDLKGKDK